MKTFCYIFIIGAHLVSPIGLAGEEVRTGPQAIIAGEVKAPGAFSLAEAPTLGELFGERAKLFEMGSTRRILLCRDGRFRYFDLSRFGDFELNEGDIVEVPTKIISSNEAERYRILILACKEPNEVVQKAAGITDERWKVRENWRKGRAGVEFRPEGRAGERGGTWVFVKPASEYEIETAAKSDPTLLKVGKAVAFISRSNSRGDENEGWLEYELALEKKIRSMCK